jgi:hypothetical protein
MRSEPLVLSLPDVVCHLWRAQQRVKAHYKQTKLEFTLDGRLVGDIAEALAMEHFRLLPPPKRTGGVDALTTDGRTVQVKATGKPKCGPAFTPGQGVADLLLFFRINFEAGTATVLYNGPEAPIRALLPRAWSGTKVVSLAEVLRLSAGVHAGDRLS